jgi:hypothetical protein
MWEISVSHLIWDFTENPSLLPYWGPLMNNTRMNRHIPTALESFGPVPISMSMCTCMLSCCLYRSLNSPSGWAAHRQHWHMGPTASNMAQNSPVCFIVAIVTKPMSSHSTIPTCARCSDLHRPALLVMTADRQASVSTIHTRWFANHSMHP